MPIHPHDTDPSATWEVASHGRRFANLLFDIIFLNLINSVLLTALRQRGLFPEAPVELTPHYLLLTTRITLPIQLFYYIFFETLFFRTPGKFLTGTRVMNLDGSDPSLRTIVLRTLVRIVPFEFLSFLGGLNQGWHDKWTDTCVVRVRPAAETNDSTDYE
jgi:uncharacterized RDD family membrane protein YckC